MSYIIEVTEDLLNTRDSFLDSLKDSDRKELFIKCSNDPAIFARYMLGFKLYGWQWYVTRQLINGKRKIILNTSRQIGKSLMSAVIALWFATFNKAGTSEFKNTKVGIISATDDQSKKVMNDIRNLMYVGDHYCRTHYSKQKDDLFDRGVFTFLIDDFRGAENTKTAMTFKSWDKDFGLLLKDSLIGSFIKSYPPTNIVRGETFDLLFVDEAAQIDDEIYNMAIERTGSKFDAIRIIASTPYGMSGFFYEYFDPDEKLPNNQWTKFGFTIDAIRYDVPLEYNKQLEAIKQDLALGKNLKVRQENYCEFVQSETSYFKPEFVDKMFDDSFPLESYSTECDLGIDFGGLKKSQTVLTVSTIDMETNIIKRLYHHAYPVREDGEILNDIQDLKRRFNIQRVIVDECPEGDFMQRKMVEKGWNVVGMKFGSEKIKKYGEFRAKLHKELIKSYMDSELQIQMKALQSKQGTERTKIQPPPGYGDDYIDSFLISTYFYISEDKGLKGWDWDDY